MNRGYTAQDVTAGPYKGRRFILLMLLLLIAMPALGAGGVLVIGDSSRSYYRSFTTSLVASLDQSGIDATIIDTDKLDSITLNGSAYRCLVTVGNDAALRLSTKQLQLPVLHALVTESFARELYSGANGQALRAFLLIDQPVSRLILLARSSMPGRHRLGVIYGPYSVRYRGEVHDQAAKTKLHLVEKVIDDPGQLGDALSYFNANADLLLTLPDPVVVNEGTAKTLILGAYLGNLPLLGYSQALVKAGALMSVYSSPEQLGVQGGELISAAFWNEATRKGALIYPQYYQVSVNYQLAHALQIDLPSENELKRRIEKLEGSR